MNANARFHAMLGDWAKQSGQHSDTLKRRVKDHLGAFTDIEIPNDARMDKLLVLLSQVFLALGKPDLMWVLPDRRSIRLYHTSAKWSREFMARATDTVYLMAAEEGVALADVGTMRE